MDLQNVMKVVDIEWCGHNIRCECLCISICLGQWNTLIHQNSLQSPSSCFIHFRRNYAQQLLAMHKPKQHKTPSCSTVSVPNLHWVCVYSPIPVNNLDFVLSRRGILLLSFFECGGLPALRFWTVSPWEGLVLVQFYQNGTRRCYCPLMVVRFSFLFLFFFFFFLSF